MRSLESCASATIKINLERGADGRRFWHCVVYLDQHLVASARHLDIHKAFDEALGDVNRTLFKPNDPGLPLTGEHDFDLDRPAGDGGKSALGTEPRRPKTAQGKKPHRGARS